ncbi:MAG: DUF2071 domain-containing protein [Bacteroidetes bacterium]|nr:DUF2071 domain-containing protein [Bacteroidota bacterium]
MEFLSAEWRKLAIANYRVDPAILMPYLPAGVELDEREGLCLVSLVAFMFEKTRILGIPAVFHRDFEEVNLRFYVRKHTPEGWRRGVVFVKEIVPKPAIALVARSVYREPYVWMPMQHHWEQDEKQLLVDYQWFNRRQKQRFLIRSGTQPQEMQPGSWEEFITEHYFGYTRWDAQSTREYAVEHPRWQVYPVQDWEIAVDFGQLYGTSFAHLREQTPHSVMLAEGSAVRVMYHSGKT